MPPYSQTTYQLFKGNSVTLNGTTSPARPPRRRRRCPARRSTPTASSPSSVRLRRRPDSVRDPGRQRRRQVATTTYTYDADGEQTSTVAPDGNLSGANAGNYTTSHRLQRRRAEDLGHRGGRCWAHRTARTTSYGYDADGNQTTSQRRPRLHHHHRLQRRRQGALVTDPDGNATLTCYDGDGKSPHRPSRRRRGRGSLTAASCPTSYPAGYSTGSPPTRPRRHLQRPRASRQATTTPRQPGRPGTRPRATPTTAPETSYRSATARDPRGGSAQVTVRHL